jgi:hypothetical protein
MDFFRKIVSPPVKSTQQASQAPRASVFDIDDRIYGQKSLKQIAREVVPPQGIKRGDIVRLRNRRKLIYTGKYFEVVGDDDSIPSEFKVNEFGLHYWSSILPNQPRFYVDLTEYTLEPFMSDVTRFRLKSTTSGSTLLVMANVDYPTWWKSTAFFEKRGGEYIPVERWTFHKVWSEVVNLIPDIKLN